MSDGEDSGADAPVEAAPALARSPAGRAARASTAAPLTEYELERLEKIKRNSAALAALNLPKLALPDKPPPAPKQRRPRAEATEAPRRSSRVAAAPRESMADPGDSDSFGRGRGFSDTDDSGADDSADGSDEDRPRRKRQKQVRVHLVNGYPAAKPGAGIVVEALREGAPAAAAPAGGVVAAPAPPLPPPTDTGRRTTTGVVRQADGLQARFGHVMQAGAPTLHAHELAELRALCTQPPYYSPVKLADLLDRVRAYARGAQASPRYVNGKFVAAEFKVSKIVANAVVRFLSRARVINTAPELAVMLERAGNHRPLGAAALAAEAAIAAGTLVRPVVSAAEATPLPPNVFVTTGRSVRLVHNSAGYKGVRRGPRGFVAELFDGPMRYNLGTFETAVEAAEKYDRAVMTVRAVTSASQLNFPLERYIEEAKQKKQLASQTAAQPTAQPAPPAPLLLAAAGDEDPLAPPTVTLAEVMGA